VDLCIDLYRTHYIKRFLEKNCSVYIQCKGDIVVVDMKQHKSQCENKKIKREGKERHKKSRNRYISPIRGEAPVNRFSPNFAHQEICWT